MALGICETMSLKIVLEKLSVEISIAMKLYCYNKATISIARNLIQHDQNKHFLNRQAFYKEEDRIRDNMYSNCLIKRSTSKYFY